MFTRNVKCYDLRLFQLLQGEQTGKVTSGSKSDPTVWLDRLAIIFRYFLLFSS